MPASFVEQVCIISGLGHDGRSEGRGLLILCFYPVATFHEPPTSRNISRSSWCGNINMLLHGEVLQMVLTSRFRERK